MSKHAATIPPTRAQIRGGDEQDVLTFLLNQGYITGMRGETRHKIAAFIEADVRNQQDIQRVIFECGSSYIGFEVPKCMVRWLRDGTIPDLWDAVGNMHKSGEGHAVLLTGFFNGGFNLISWGQKYIMSPAFFASCVDEAYGIADHEFITATGKSPLGLTITALEAQMAALKKAA